MQFAFEYEHPHCLATFLHRLQSGMRRILLHDPQNANASAYAIALGKVHNECLQMVDEDVEIQSADIRGHHRYSNADIRIL